MEKIASDREGSLEALLNLDGEIFPMDNGYWVKFDVHLVSASKHIPHGVRYTLTLHNRNNIRVIGFDNAHGVQQPKKHRYAARKITWDHQHHLDKVESYEFESAGQLLEDFWLTVEEYLGD